MLIRIMKKSTDLLEGKPHEPNQEVSRRGFLKSAVAGAASFTVMPAMLSLLRTNPARAAAFSCGNVDAIGTSYTQIALAGGNGFTRMMFAWGIDGQPLVGASRSLGTLANDTVDATTIPGIYLNNNETFAIALKAGGQVTANGVTATRLFSPAVTTEILSRLSGSQIACPRNDDTDDNPTNAMVLFGGNCGLRKGILTDVAGDAARDRSITSLRNDFAVTRSGGSVANLVAGARLPNNPVNDARMANAIESALASLTQEQKANIEGQVGSADFVKKLMAGVASNKNKFDPNAADIALNPANPVNAAVFAARAPLVALTAKEQLFQALFDASAKQQVGAVNLVEGGFDYHNGGNNIANVRHAFLARFILLWAWVHISRGTNGVLQLDTDGGIGWDTNGNALGDRGSSSMSVFLHIAGDKSKPVPRFKRQGYYSGLISEGGGESASRDPLVAKRGENPTVACALTYGLLTGRLNTSDGSIPEFLAKVNERGTIVTSVSQLMTLSLLA